MIGQPAMGPDRVRGLIAGGMAIVILLFGGFGAWAALAPLAGAVIAPGRLVADGNRKTMQHRDGGIVREILVRDGDWVAAGDVLLRLDTTERRAERAALAAERAALIARDARLRADRDGGEPVPPQGEAGADEAMTSQLALLAARRAQDRAEAAVLRQRADRTREAMPGVRARLVAAEARIALLREDEAAVRRLLGRDFATRARQRERERALAEAQGARAALTADLAGLEQRVAEIELSLVRRERERLALIADEQETVRRDLARTAPRLESLDQMIARAELRAPAGGRVLGLAVHTIGGVIAAGDRVFDIVPTGAALLAEARVAPRDVQRPRPGIGAEIRLDGISARLDRLLEATVTSISAYRVSDAASGGSFYTLRVALAADAAAAPLQLGMPVSVVVATEPRTALDYALAPLQDAMARSLREE